MIVDLSYWNRPVNWGAVDAECVMVRGPIGDRWIDDDYLVNWQGAKARPRQGVYCDLITGQSGAAQALNILHQTGGDLGTEAVALDVERTKAERLKQAAGWVFPKAQYTAMLWDVVQALQSVHPVRIYTNKGEWEAMTTQPAWAVELLNWIAQYNAHISAPDVPAGWTWDWWQFGQAQLAGVPEPADVSRERVKTMPDLSNRGCLLGGHTQGNSSITPIFAALKARGARLKLGITDEDGGKVIEWLALGVETRINRKHLPETGPNHWMEGGGDADIPLTPQQKRDFVDTAKRLPYRASPTEFKASTHFQVTGNEWERNSPQGWLDYLDLIQQVIVEGNQMSTHDKAMLMGISDAEAATLPPVKYAIPVFNAGSPHTWAMYVAIAGHPIWPIVQAEGHLAWCHEGISFDQPFDWGEDQPVEPGAPMAPGAGLVNFRIFNLLWLLWQKGIRVKWGAGEWYDGRRPREEQVDLRVLNMIRHDTILSASPFAADCVGYAQFQFDNNPASDWYAQDCTLLWETDRWQQHVIDVSERINGGPYMPEVPQDTLNQLAANARTQATIAAADLALLAPYVAAHVWAPGDVARAIVNPLFTYTAPGGPVHDTRPKTPPGGPMVTYDLDVIAVTADQLWLEVAANIWVKTADVKLKA